MSMSFGQVRDEVLSQHAHLRALIDKARRLADRASYGADTLDSVTGALKALAEAVKAHNEREEALLGGVPPGAVRGDLMDDRHVEEHRELHAAIVGACFLPTEFAGATIVQLLDDLLEHMDEEEALFGEERTLSSAPLAG